jgi:hypothetical protein
MDEREQLGVSDWRQTGNWQGQGQAKMEVLGWSALYEGG